MTTTEHEDGNRFEEAYQIAFGNGRISDILAAEHYATANKMPDLAWACREAVAMRAVGEAPNREEEDVGS